MSSGAATVVGATRHRLAPAPSLDAVVQLARLEGRRLLRHPLFLAGCAMSAAYFANTWDEPNGTYLGLTGGGAMGPGLGTLLAANAAALRDRTSGAHEVVSATSLSEAERTVASLLAVLWPVLATATVVAVAAVASGGAAPVAFPHGVAEVRPSAAALVQGPAFVALAGTLGVALARWLPSRLVGLVVAITAFFAVIPTFFWGLTQDWRYLMPLADHSRVVDWVQVTAGSGHTIVDGFDDARMASHVAYLLALVAAFAGLALVRSRQGRRAGALLGVAVVAVAVLAGVQLR